MSKSSKEVIKGTSGWKSGEKFFEFIQDLKIDMREYLKINDIDGLIHTYTDYVIELFPYIEQYFDKNITFEDIWINDLLGYSNKFFRGDTNHARTENRKLIMEMNQILTQKKLKISKLIARAELFLPINKPDGHIPAVFGSDDY